MNVERTLYVTGFILRFVIGIVITINFFPVIITISDLIDPVSAFINISLYNQLRMTKNQTNSVRFLKKASLCFLIKESQVLLAMKKRGFGQGKWNGVGGKQNPNETIKATAIRETQEEIGITALNLKHVATLNFLFPNMPKDNNWNQQVWVYFVDRWEGAPIETEEMAPQWFNKTQLPYDQMWDDDKLWLPKVLNGEFVTASFEFDENQKLIEYTIND